MTIDAQFVRCPDFYFDAKFSKQSFTFEKPEGKFNIHKTYTAFTNIDAGTPLPITEANSLNHFMAFFRKISAKKRYLCLNPDLKGNCLHSRSFNCMDQVITVITPNSQEIIFLISKNPYPKINLVRDKIGATSFNYMVSYVSNDINHSSEARDESLSVMY
jgi:hypothetical protein